MLGKQLVEDDEAGDGAVWEMLADVWVELVVYVSPSRAEEHARGHEAALVQGSELVTLLWVLATHTGIARPDHDGESTSRRRRHSGARLHCAHWREHQVINAVYSDAYVYVCPVVWTTLLSRPCLVRFNFHLMWNLFVICALLYFLLQLMSNMLINLYILALLYVTDLLPVLYK